MENKPQKFNLVFNPHINLLTIAQGKVRLVLGGLIYLFLILFGIYGVWALIAGFAKVFYLSLLTSLFLFYLGQRKKERISKIKLPPAGKETEVWLFLDRPAQKALEKSWLFAYRKGYHCLRPIHLFASFLKGKEFKKILKRLDCQPKKVVEKTKNILSSSDLFPASERNGTFFGPKIAADFREIFLKAYLFCLKKNKEQIGLLDILWAISQQRNLVGMIFDEFGITPEEIEQVVEWAQLEEEIKQWEKSFFWQRLFKPKGKLNRTMTAALTPLLDKVSRDLTFLARQGQFEMVIGRQKELGEIFNLFSAGRAGVILVGPSAIGKKAILKKLAQLMVTENVPKFLEDKRLIQLDLSSLVSLSGARQRGEEYLRQIIHEINRADNIILAIENLESLAGLKTGAGGLDFAEILSSALEQKAFYFIGATTPQGFADKIESGALGRALNKIEVPLPPRDALWQILITKIYLIEKELKIFFSADALSQAINLADRYVYGKALPAKAMDLLTETAYAVRKKRGVNSFVEGNDITELMARKTKVPLGQIEETEKEKLLRLEEIIHERIVNQEEAVEAVAEAMRRSRLEVQSRKRPIANFLFVGPTGVGKTETAKVLAQAYFGDEKKMIRLDMSEYQEKRGLRRLIGSRGEGDINRGYLTEAVKRQPYSLLLLDEIEKSEPALLNLFLQVMDDGRLTDISGETINFSNIIVIATSNAGTHFIQEKIAQGLDYQEVEKQLKETILLEHFRPEFLNRFDKIVLFKALTMDNMNKIARLFLNGVRKKLEEKGIVLEVEEEAVEELAQKGYDPLYGARPLRRVIQDEVESVIAQLILEDKARRRDTIILKKGLQFEVKQAPKI